MVVPLPHLGIGSFFTVAALFLQAAGASDLLCEDPGKSCATGVLASGKYAALLQIEVAGDASGSLRHVSPEVRHPWRRHRETAAILAIQDGDGTVFSQKDREAAAKIGMLHDELEDLWEHSSIAAGSEMQTTAWMSLVSTKARLDSVYGSVRAQLDDLHRQIATHTEGLGAANGANAHAVVPVELTKLQARARGLASLLQGGREHNGGSSRPALNQVSRVEVRGAEANSREMDASKHDMRLVQRLHARHAQLEELWGHLVQTNSDVATQARTWTKFVEAKMALDASYEEARSRYEDLYRKILVLRNQEKATSDEGVKHHLQTEAKALQLRASAMREASKIADSI